MEGEVHNLIVDWIIVLASLLYSNGVGMFIAQGTTRFLALFPVIILFICLPLNLHTMFLCGLTSFFISWLASFKLILFGQPPLHSHPPLPLSHFIATTCLPIKIIKNIHQENNPSHQINKKTPKDYASRIFLLVVTMKVYGYKDHLHPLLTTSLYAYYLFFMLELLLAMTATLARTVIGVELEPQFDKPHHATSVQNFWGKRWNLMVSSILRPTFYHPARAIFRHVVPERWISVPAVLTTFVVSGVVHELIFYYLGRLTPTWEVTWFFVVQGGWIGLEIVVKKTFVGQWLQPVLPGVVARLLTLAFVTVTSFWLFFPPFMQLDPFGRACKEAMAFLGFLKNGHLLSPSEYTCPVHVKARGN